MLLCLVSQVNTQNRRYRAQQSNLSQTEEIGNSHIIKVKVWVAISSQGTILYEVLEEIQTAETYLQLLQRQLGMMDLQENYFQQDGAPIHTANKVVKYLKSNYHHHWIGKKWGGEKEWAPRSPDLSPLDYFFWSYVQAQLLSHNLETKADFHNSLILEIPRVPKKMIQQACSSIIKRCEKCIEKRGKSMGRSNNHSRDESLIHY